MRKPSVPKTVTGGSNPSAPAKFKHRPGPYVQHGDVWLRFYGRVVEGFPKWHHTFTKRGDSRCIDCGWRSRAK